MTWTRKKRRMTTLNGDVWSFVIILKPDMSLNAHVGQFYERDHALHGHKTIVKNNDLRDRAVILIEGRSVFWTKHVMKRAMRVLGDSWNYYVVETPSGTASNREAFRACNIGYRTLDMPNITRDHYSCLLKTVEFWNMFREEHLLIIQTDSIVLRPLPDHLLTYDIVGAPCGEDVLNGGTTLRRRSAMIDVLTRHTADFIDNPEEPEDITFCRAMRKYPSEYRIPTLELCARFFYESGPVPPHPVSCAHGTTKNWGAEWKKLLQDVRY